LMVLLLMVVFFHLVTHSWIYLYNVWLDACCSESTPIVSHIHVVLVAVDRYLHVCHTPQLHAKVFNTYR
jgi:hypothetical protein